MTKLQALQEKYFDKLEENGIEFYNFEDIDNHQTEAVLKDEYDVSVKEMRAYLGQDTNIPEEIHEIIDETLNEIDVDKEILTILRDQMERLYSAGFLNGEIHQINKTTNKHLHEATDFMNEEKRCACGNTKNINDDVCIECR